MLQSLQAVTQSAALNRTGGRAPAPAPSSMRGSELRREEGDVSRDTLSRAAAGAGAGRRHLAQAASSQGLAASQGKVTRGQPAQASFKQKLHWFLKLLSCAHPLGSCSLAHLKGNLSQRPLSLMYWHPSCSASNLRCEGLLMVACRQGPVSQCKG